jgi:hypothetical protein
MASETPLLDRLNWLAPVATHPCAYEAAGWSCGSTGFLWFSEIRDGGERLYPCPRCNTELFLAKSRERVSAERGGAQCACCGQGLARLAYESALDEAQRVMAKSPDPTRAAK